MRKFFDFVVWRFSTTGTPFWEWAETRKWARHAHYIVHNLKSEWLFSGVLRDEKGYHSDAGFTRSPRLMNRAQALRYFKRFNPNATIKHIDDRNKIITFIGR